MVQTRSQMKASGVQLPEVHGSRKRLDPHTIPEKQTQPIVRLDVDRKPRIGQGRVGVRRKAPFWTQDRELLHQNQSSLVMRQNIRYQNQ